MAELLICNMKSERVFEKSVGAYLIIYGLICKLKSASFIQLKKKKMMNLSEMVGNSRYALNRCSFVADT
jgi:hypothetical protein